MTVSIRINTQIFENTSELIKRAKMSISDEGKIDVNQFTQEEIEFMHESHIIDSLPIGGFGLNEEATQS